LLYYEHASRDEPKVALTFDDGPNPPRTEEVAAILEAHGVRGSFFLIGKWVEQFPRSVDRLVANGHVVGNHSYEHAIRVSDYDRAEMVIGHVTGRRSRFLRPHSFDFASANNSLVSRLDDTYVVDADVNPRDYAVNDVDAIVRGVLENPRLGNGSIVDLHDGSEIADVAQRHSRPLPMIAALPAIITGLVDRGFELVTLDEMTFTDAKEWVDGDESLLNTNPTQRGLVRRVHPS
jgi:peptidoglycan/xylan/chitin deacetylase (PgdA/CDA1 family)